MKNDQHKFNAQPYPRTRLLMVDGGRLGLKKHTIHGLVEFDISKARETILLHRKNSAETLSFSAFFLACLGKAIDPDKQLHAYRSWRNQLIIFDEVDVNMLFEVEVDGEKTIRPHILRGINKKTASQIQQEIDTFQSRHQESRKSKFIDRFVLLPGFIRRLFLRILFMNPDLIKEYYGTVLVSSVGMFGSGSGWGIPVPNHSLQLTLGGVGNKAVMAAGGIEMHKFMSITISVDHDVIDGAPIARFTQRLKKLVEAGYKEEIASQH